MTQRIFLNNNVTILIPLYNDENQIKKTVLSVVNQAEFIIISDNGSTDRSYEICIELAKEYKNIKIFQQVTNLGGVGNLDFLYKLVKTKYVMNIGSHDYLESSYIEKLKTILEKNVDAVMAFAPVISVSDSNEIIEETMLDDFARDFGCESPVNRVYAAIIMEYNYAFYGLFRYDIFLKNMDFTKEAGVDHLIMTKCAKDGKFLRCINTRFYLRVPTRTESTDKYMERLAGGIYEIDMSYTCVNQLNMLDSLDYKNQKEKNQIYNKAKLNLQSRYLNYCKKYTQFILNKIAKSNCKYILYGAGTDSQRMMSVLKDKILFIVDKDVSKKGKKMNNINIYSVEKINEYIDISIIISQIGRCSIISSELITEYGINASRLISLDVDKVIDYE